MRARLATATALALGATLAVTFGWGFVRSFLDPAVTSRSPFGSDFAFFWTVSAALRGGGLGSVLDPEALRRFAPYAIPGDFYRWVYPPPALLLFAPLAALPFVPAFAAWSAAGLAAYLATSLAIVRRPGALLLAAGFPAAFHALANGQLTFLVLALLGLALVLLPSRPVAAGLLAGLLVVKPQHALLLPVALLAGRHWRALAGAAAAALATSAAATLAFGAGAWAGSLRGLGYARWLLESGHVAHFKYASPFSAVRLAGGGVGAAYAVQAAAAAAAACAVAWLWSRPARHELRAAGLVIAGLLATPHSFHYDLALLGLPLAFALRLGGWSQAAWGAWAAGWLGAAACAFVARASGVQLAPALLAVLLLVVLRRAARDARLAAGAPPPLAGGGAVTPVAPSAG